MVINLYIGTEKLDLFGDEEIQLNSSIADVSDITKNTTEYTKSFTVPATDQNNFLFKHYYDANIDNGFDARIKQDGYIELDGILFKKGKFRLNKVSLKNGRPHAYTINFWGNLTSIKDKLKKDELKDLDLSAFDHAYDFTTVKTGLTSSLFSGALKYTPLIKKQLYYNNNAADNVRTDTLANIAFGGGANVGISFTELRPSLKLIKIIEAIETDYGITFSRDFFGRSEFDNLYLWLNPDSDDDAGGDTQTIDWNSGDSTYMNLTTNIGAYPCRRSTTGSDDHLFWNFRLSVYPDTGYENVEYEMIFDVDGTEESTRTATGDTADFGVFFNKEGAYQVYNCQWKIKSAQEFKYTANIWQQKTDRTLPLFSQTTVYNTAASLKTIDSYFTVNENMPKIKVIDFIKGLFNAFKLVIIPLNDDTFYVNTLKDYYSEGQLFDFTRYVDYSVVDIERGDILNEINFKFEEPTTILNTQFTKNSGVSYGNQEVLLKDDVGELLDGDTLEFTLPFEQVLYERLADNNDNLYTNFQYGAIIDDNSNKVNPKSHIHYVINQSLGTKTVAILNQTGVKESVGTVINIPSHTDTFDNQTFSMLFDNEFSSWDGSLTQNTLYTNYHQGYIAAIFNPKRRNFKYSANIPLRFLTQLSLNDLIQIKDNYYRIDNYNLNLLTGKVDFTLINSFDNTIVGFYPDTTFIDVLYLAEQKSIYVVNLGNFTSLKVDTGDGVSWVTVSSSGNNIYFDIDENTSGVERFMNVTITNDDTLQSFTIYITQGE